MRHEYDTLVVGAGFAGAVLAERLAAGRGERVLVIDRRDHIAGREYQAMPNEGYTRMFERILDHPNI